MPGRRGRRAVGADAASPTAQRETLERRWRDRLVLDDHLALLVTGQGRAREPFHRWLPYRAAFAPELVRRFLAEAMDSTACVVGDARRPGSLKGRGDPLVLDPFAGCGTVVIECARRGRPAIGVEALESLAFVASAAGATHVPDLPDLAGCTGWLEIAPRLDEPIHRAALICAAARQHTSEGKFRQDAPPLLDLLAEVIAMMREDVSRPLTVPVRIDPGDARRLDSIDDASVAGVLTSPPYLSRYDYTRLTRVHEEVYRCWYPGSDLAQRRRDQVRAHPKAHRRTWERDPPAAVHEVCEALAAGGSVKTAGVVRSYFDDVFAAVEELRRVLRPDAPCWIVIGGARLDDVYVPSDLIVADYAASRGLRVETMRVARRLTPSGRKLGRLMNVAPRESILVLRRGG